MPGGRGNPYLLVDALTGRPRNNRGWVLFGTSGDMDLSSMELDVERESLRRLTPMVAGGEGADALRIWSRTGL